MKNTFLQSPIIALQHVKNSAWAIEKLYRKTCVRNGLLRVIYTTIANVNQALYYFSPVFRQNWRLKKALWYTVSPYETTLQKDKKFQIHIGWKKPPNSENILKTGHKLWTTLWPSMTFENQNMTGLNLTFIHRNTHVFAFVSYANIS